MKFNSYFDGTVFTNISGLYCFFFVFFGGGGRGLNKSPRLSPVLKCVTSVAGLFSRPKA